MTEDGLRATIGTISSLVRSIHLKRALTAIDADPKLNFWRLIYGNLLDMATLEWCKLFGSDHEQHQPVHWKNMVSDVGAFRTALLAHLGLDENSFNEYWASMKRYRDTRVAHLDFKRPDVNHYPDLQIALESACFYYDQILPEWRALGEDLFPDDIDDYCRCLAAQCNAIAKIALGSTADLEERVY